jgi:RpiB/LacA/LacB family sugar-phosphate isomerase
MRVAVASDHAGFVLKTWLLAALRPGVHELVDLGTDSERSVDYPDFAEAIANAVLDGRADRGILICGSGVGASVAANKRAGIRAGLCHDTYSARQGVEHDDINVLVLGSRVIGPELALELVRAFLAATFTGEPRHVRRLAKVRAIESATLRRP